jgi:type IV pilus assembly protein PilP
VNAVRVLLIASVLPWGALAQAPQEPAASVREASAAAPEVAPYSPAGRRDPFRPFILDIRRPDAPVQLTPLQRYELGQLTVVATVWETSVPRAMVEDSVGMGYIVGVGTPIGRNGGVVTGIEPQRVVVEERVLDFYGNEQVNRIVMETPKEDPNQQARERK